MYCNNCTTKLAENSLYCHNCGSPVFQSNDLKIKNNEQNQSAEMPNNLKSDFNVEITNENEKEKNNFKKQILMARPKRLTKKKIIILICSLALLIGIIISVCIGSGSSSNNYGSSYNSSSSLEDTLESLATSALYNELQNHFSYSNAYNIGATRYSIGTITENGTQWIVRGTFSIYDYYGKLTSFYNETFTVSIDKNTYRTTCTTSL